LNGSVSSISCLAEPRIADQRQSAIANEHKEPLKEVTNTSTPMSLDAKVDQLIIDAETMEKRVNDLMMRCKIQDTGSVHGRRFR